MHPSPRWPQAGLQVEPLPYYTESAFSRCAPYIRVWEGLPLDSVCAAFCQQLALLVSQWPRVLFKVTMFTLDSGRPLVCYKGFLNWQCCPSLRAHENPAHA